MNKTIKIEGMSCGHCANHVKKELEGICGVTSADVSADEKRAIVELAHEVEDSKFEAVVAEAGYEVVGIE
jgi:Cu+-exporting ATPase